MPEIIIVLRDGSDRIIDTDPEYSLMEAIRDAGVDEFISVKANCYDILRMLQQKKGMKITEEEVK